MSEQEKPDSGKPEANAHVNLAADYIALGEPQRARDHLRRAEEIFEADMWFRWRYNIRTKAELARYALARRVNQSSGRKRNPAFGDTWRSFRAANRVGAFRPVARAPIIRIRPAGGE